MSNIWKTTFSTGNVEDKKATNLNRKGKCEALLFLFIQENRMRIQGGDGKWLLLQFFEAP